MKSHTKNRCREFTCFLPPRTFPPIGRTNCFLIGDNGDRCFVVDPAPLNSAEYEKLVSCLKKFAFTDIFITHHHLDHHERAPQLAREFSVPISISEDSFQRLIKKIGKNYFEGIDIHRVREGDRLTQWRGNDVKVYEIPGHDEGHLGLAPDNMEWFLAGDLIQGMGTVMIGKDAGDMAKYFQSLERVIGLAPNIVLPSHGSPQTSTHSIKKTLKHRKKREKQVLKLHKKGKTPEQMVEDIYRGVDRHLWPFAFENVLAHLQKLKDDGLVAE